MDYDCILMEIGSKGNFSEQDRLTSAMAFRLARGKYPEANIGFTIGGYDDDPREIYDIPEAREYIRQWASDAGLSNWQDAIEIPWEEGLYNLGILQICGVFGADSPIKVNTPTGVRTS